MFTTRLIGRCVVPNIRWLGSLVLIGVVFAVASDAAHAQYIFWSDLDSKSIFRADFDGSNRTTIFQKTTGFVGPRGLAFDEPSRQLYWISDGSIFQSNIDGSQIDVRKYTDTLANPSAIALDLSGRLGGLGPKIYLGGGEMFFHVNPDGTDLSLLFEFADDPEVESLAIDFEQGRFYWSVHSS